MRRTPRVGLAAVVALGLGLTACRGGSASSAPTGPANALASIPDTAAYRSFVAVNDLQGLWRSAGLPFPPSVAQVASPQGNAASRQIVGGSRVGSQLWALAPDTNVLGYDPFALSEEVVAGQPPNELSIVRGNIDASKVEGALAAAGLQPVSRGAIMRYEITQPPLQLPSPMDTALLGVSNLAILQRGGRMTSGGAGVSAGEVINLLRDLHSSPSLASDPAVSQTLALLKGTDVMAFGTSLVVKGDAVLGPNASPQAFAQFGHRLGLDRLPAAPTFAGYGYLPGDPTHATVLAVAIYPNANDAQAAASILGNVLRFGVSPAQKQPYSQLLAVDTITIKGDALVARMTDRRAGVMAVAVEQNDFPLFWSPLPPSGG